MNLHSSALRYLRRFAGGGGTCPNDQFPLQGGSTRESRPPRAFGFIGAVLDVTTLREFGM